MRAVAFGMAACLAHADDTAQPPPGYKLTTVNIGGKPVQVQEYDPFSKVKAAPPADGKYHPTEMNFSATSSMAEKKFGASTDTLAKGDPDLLNSEKNAFVTKSYTDDAFASGQADFNNKAKMTSTGSYSRNANGFEKAYATSNADADQNKPALLASSKSTDQDHTAVIGGHDEDMYQSAMSGKTFEGPEADAVHRHLSKLPNGQMLVTDIPNRPMTIDEVRNLINHGFKPATDEKPPEASKPLNDPDYKPQPLRDMPDSSANDSLPASPANDDDKNDPVPPPGTMAAPAAPENSEPLPQP